MKIGSLLLTVLPAFGNKTLTEQAIRKPLKLQLDCACGEEVRVEFDEPRMLYRFHHAGKQSILELTSWYIGNEAWLKDVRDWLEMLHGDDEKESLFDRYVQELAANTLSPALS